MDHDPTKIAKEVKKSVIYTRSAPLNNSPLAQSICVYILRVTDQDTPVARICQGQIGEKL